MAEVRLPGLTVIVALCGIGAFLTAVMSAFRAEGINALISWTLVCMSLFLCVGLYFRSNIVRFFAVGAFGLFLLWDIGLLALAIIQASKSGETFSPSVGFFGGVAINAWALWYLMRPSVRDAFKKLRPSSESI